MCIFVKWRRLLWHFIRHNMSMLTVYVCGRWRGWCRRRRAVSWSSRWLTSRYSVRERYSAVSWTPSAAWSVPPSTSTTSEMLTCSGSNSRCTWNNSRQRLYRRAAYCSVLRLQRHAVVHSSRVILCHVRTRRFLQLLAHGGGGAL